MKWLHTTADIILWCPETPLSSLNLKKNVNSSFSLLGVLFALWAKLWIFQLIQGFKGCFAISASDLNSASENRPNNAFFLRLHVLPFYICLFEIWRLLFHLYSSYTCVFSCPNCRYDQRGYALTSQSLSETKSGGSGTRMNWKTLSDVKKENLGHGEKVQNTYMLCQPAHTWESVWELSTCSRSHRNVKKNLICRGGGVLGVLCLWGGSLWIALLEQDWCESQEILFLWQLATVDW